MWGVALCRLPICASATPREEGNTEKKAREKSPDMRPICDPCGIRGYQCAIEELKRKPKPKDDPSRQRKDFEKYHKYEQHINFCSWVE